MLFINKLVQDIGENATNEEIKEYCINTLKTGVSKKTIQKFKPKLIFNNTFITNHFKKWRKNWEKGELPKTSGNKLKRNADQTKHETARITGNKWELKGGFFYTILFKLIDWSHSWKTGTFNLENVSSLSIFLVVIPAVNRVVPPFLLYPINSCRRTCTQN